MRNGNRRLMRRLVQRSPRREPSGLDITAFMNLMIVLVPFLLIGAIFSQLAIVELNLPLSRSAPAPSQETPPARLMLVIRQAQITLTEKSAGELAYFEWSDTQTFDWTGFRQAVNDARFTLPGVRDITLLSEPDVEYEVLVRFMDTLASPDPQNGGRAYFGAISLGAAPALDASTGDRG